MFDVSDEVSPLRRVVVHKPGDEIVRMTQWELEPLLFDDILAVDVARAEHDLLVEILEHGGAEVLEVADLLTRALETAPPEAIATLLEHTCEFANQPQLAPLLAAWERRRLAGVLITGARWDEVPEAPTTLGRMRESLDGDHSLAVPPVPNLMFMRDPCFTVYDRVVMGRMHTQARARESLLVHFALSHGMDGPPPFLFDHPDYSLHPSRRSIEGGDVLVISPELMLIGCSERTTPQTVERVANDVLFPAFPKLQRVMAVFMPRLRSVMHLDTALTAIDHNLFLGYAPMVSEGQGVHVVELSRTAPPALHPGLSVQSILERELGSVEIVPCGGDDPLHQAREQWTDGANAVCIAPGRIVLYDRNVRTIQTLVENHGFDQVLLSSHMSAEERRQRLAATDTSDRVVYTFQGSELSRARGGARCLTMPLLRG